MSIKDIGMLKTYLSNCHWIQLLYTLLSTISRCWYSVETLKILLHSKLRLNIKGTRKYPLRRYILGVLMHTTAWDQLCGVDVFSRFYIRAAAVWLCTWNSDNVVWKSSVRTSASVWQEQSNWGVRLTQDAYLSLWTHTKQLLLVTFCHTNTGNGANFRTHGWRTDGRMAEDGRTDRRGSRNSYLNVFFKIYKYSKF